MEELYLNILINNIFGTKNALYRPLRPIITNVSLQMRKRLVTLYTVAVCNYVTDISVLYTTL